MNILKARKERERERCIRAEVVSREKRAERRATAQALTYQAKHHEQEICYDEI